MTDQARYQIDSMLAERKKMFDRQHELLDRSGSERRTLDAPEQAEFDRLAGEIREISARKDEWEAQSERERVANAARAGMEHVVRPGNGGHSRDRDELRALFRGEIRELNLEPTEKRDLLVGSATTGGPLVPTTLANQVVYYLETYSGIRRSNVTILNTSGGENFDVPRLQAYGTAVIVGEASAIPESDPVLGKITLGAWKYARLLQVSSELVEDTRIDLNGLIARESGAALAAAYGPDLINGSGTNKPFGIAAACGTAVVSQTGATGVPSYSDVTRLVYGVAYPYRTLRSQFLTADANIGALRRILDTTGRPIWEPSVQAGSPDRLLGYEVIADNNIHAFGTAASQHTMVFGDLSGYWIRSTGVRLEVSREYAWANDLSTWRVIERLDGDLVDPNAVKCMTAPVT